MKTDTATIIVFPNAHRGTEAKPRCRQPLHQLASQPDTPPAPKERDSARGLSKPLVARPEPRPLTAEEHDRHVTTVVRIAIRSAKRRGVRLESLLSIPRKWLLDLCDEGDPTCLVVRDWLFGNRKYLSKDLEDVAIAWESSKWGDA